MNIEIGSYEAKTRLPELLRGVQNGQCYTITLRGTPIADLVPAASNKTAANTAAIARLRALMARAVADETLDIKALIEAGRA